MWRWKTEKGLGVSFLLNTTKALNCFAFSVESVKTFALLFFCTRFLLKCFLFYFALLHLVMFAFSDLCFPFLFQSANAIEKKKKSPKKSQIPN